jgi:hypothetical protein
LEEGLQVNLLPLIFVIGLASAGAVAVIRAVVQELRPLWLLYKPLSCDLCMAWWCSVGAVPFVAESIRLFDAALVVFGGVGVSLLAVKAANRLSAD